MAPANDPSSTTLRLLVAIASYGSSNDRHLRRVIEEYRSMSFCVDIVVLSNIEKSDIGDVKCSVGLPNKNPWSLPFAHQNLFSDNVDRYDLFIYSEDDILVSERNIRAFLDVTEFLEENEIAGFLRWERKADGGINYPDVHGCFHWDPELVRSRKGTTFAHFTNEHAGCYILTRAQLRRAIETGGFVVEPHDGKYDLLCTAATDIYTQCGFKKLIPISRFEEFAVHHLSNKYAEKIGVDGEELNRQVDALLANDGKSKKNSKLLVGETKLWRGIYSKDYYEPANDDAISLIPSWARSVLSIGSGLGATERALYEKGLSVTAIPLNNVISEGLRQRGVDVISADFNEARDALNNAKFDCILYLNVLHLIANPTKVLTLFNDVITRDSTIVIQSPNMWSIPEVWRRVRNFGPGRRSDFNLTGLHWTGVREVQEWCRLSGLAVDRTIGLLHRRAKMLDGLSSGVATLPLSPNFITIARREERLACFGT